jgi:p-aminobenzoyl-glutamate transporter AbgT
MDNREESHHRTRLGALEQEVAGVKGEVGGLKLAMADQTAKLAGVSEQMHQIARAMEKMADRVHAPTTVNWGWIIAAVMGIMSLGGAFTSIVVQPLRATADQQYDQIRAADSELRKIDARLSFEEGYRQGRNAQ